MSQTIKKKQIILVRHAKAVDREKWNGSDFDRPLISDGENSNQIVANYLRLIGVKPDRIVSSPSARTKATAIGLSTKFRIAHIDYVYALYNEHSPASRHPMKIHMDVVQKNTEDCKVLMIVGHNNDLSEFASYLSGESVPSMKKGSIIVLSLPDGMEWEDVRPGKLKFI